jgi:hypothetical protein
MNKVFLYLFVFFISISVQAQNLYLRMESTSVPSLGGIQSYAFGQANGKWLIVGGRLDGLHRRQPFASFDVAGHNTQIIVIDPISNQKWNAPLSSLPQSIQEQLSSTNMNFHQNGDYLYCIGGYGYSSTAANHTTYPYLTAIDVPAVINAVIQNQNLTSYFRQISDTMFQVAGGRLKKIYDQYYLLGGQKFIGRYNPMGPNHGPGFTQIYTNSIRIFNINDNGTNIQIQHLPSHIDAANLHRRDYNAEPQIMPNGEQGITMFSGVFQANVDLPFLNCVNVDSSGYQVNNSFQQYYNHYHCAVLPLYSESNNEMSTVFFGGIAQYYNSNGSRIKDDNVPFVKTIAVVKRDANGQMTETVLPIEMPGYLGAGAEFIPNPDLARFGNDVIKLDSISQDSVLLGHIFGGINSSLANIFFINNGSQSSANAQIFEVYLQKTPVSIQENPKHITAAKLYPNPASQLVNIEFILARNADVNLNIYDAKGSIIYTQFVPKLAAGKNTINLDLNNELDTGIYHVILESNQLKKSLQLLVE